MADETSSDRVPDRTIRGANFREQYANNVGFESSVWDLKLIFGSLDQFSIPPTISQHTAMTVPWMQAKLMVYYLLVNVAIHEASHGKVQVPDALMPRPIEGILDGPLGEDPKAKAIVERVNALRADIF